MAGLGSFEIMILVAIFFLLFGAERLPKLARAAGQSNLYKVIDISNKFLNEDGKLPKDIMPDALHPNARGYEIWASSIEEKICELGGWEKVKG